MSFQQPGHDGRSQCNEERVEPNSLRPRERKPSPPVPAMPAAHRAPTSPDLHLTSNECPQEQQQQQPCALRRGSSWLLTLLGARPLLRGGTKGCAWQGHLPPRLAANAACQDPAAPRAQLPHPSPTPSAAGALCCCVAHRTTGLHERSTYKARAALRPVACCVDNGLEHSKLGLTARVPVCQPRGPPRLCGQAQGARSP